MFSGTLLQLATTGGVFSLCLSLLWRWQPAPPNPEHSKKADTDEQISPWFTLVYAVMSPLHIFMQTPMFLEAWRSSREALARFANRRGRLYYRTITCAAASTVGLVIGEAVRRAAAKAVPFGASVSGRMLQLWLLPLWRATMAHVVLRPAVVAGLLAASIPHSLLFAWVADRAHPQLTRRDDLHTIFARCARCPNPACSWNPRSSVVPLPCNQRAAVWCQV